MTSQSPNAQHKFVYVLGFEYLDGSGFTILRVYYDKEHAYLDLDLVKDCDSRRYFILEVILISEMSSNVRGEND